MHIVKLLKALAAFIERMVGIQDTRLSKQADNTIAARANEYELEVNRKDAAYRALIAAKANATAARKKGVAKIDTKQAKINEARAELANLKSK